jgi:SpoVK/Ycf46/Vps4 family AAA+-type ATPase
MNPSLNAENCRYLLIMQKNERLFQLKSEIYIHLIIFLGSNGLEILANYVKRHLKRYSKTKKKEARQHIHTETAKARRHKSDYNSLINGWINLYNLLNSEHWNSAVSKPLDINHIFTLLLRLAARSGEQSRNQIFEKRLNLLSETLELEKADKELLRFFFVKDYNDLEGKLFESACQALKTSSSRINYAAIALLINLPEETILETISKDRGLMNMGILSYAGRLGIEISFEIRRYLKGLGSDNIMDIYATVDKKPALPLSKFEYQKEAKFITDLISIHENDRPLHFLLYGMEGTGKTELARTIAANANCELLDIGRDIKKQLFEESDCLTNAIRKFRARALNVAETVFKNKRNLVLLVDEADTLLNHFEKGTLNQMLEDMRLPVIWISNDLFFMQRSTMRRFNYSIEFKPNNPSMRLKLWESVVEKYDASEIFTNERIKTLAEKYEAAPGGIELAVSNEVLLAKAGKQEEVAELVLKQHTELLGLKSNYKNTQSRAPKYDESLLNVQGIDRAMHAAKCYAELLRNKETESNCTMLLYGAPGTGKTEFAKYLARISGLPFKEISYGKISSAYVGETEKKLARAFEEASEEGALLFIDEADSLISDRRSAHHSWETTQVNEFLVQLENSKCLVVCSTNFQGKLDTASNRRFHFHLKFDYLKEDGILKMAQNFFPELEQENWKELRRLECLTPGDFYAVYKRLQWLPKEELSAGLVTKELSDVALAKEAYGNRRIGF